MDERLAIVMFMFGIPVLVGLIYALLTRRPKSQSD
jgi:hypothetical protein